MDKQLFEAHQPLGRTNLNKELCGIFTDKSPKTSVTLSNVQVLRAVTDVVVFLILQNSVVNNALLTHCICSSNPSMTTACLWT
ncbi:unnamed protein product [Larinioides sclopetarius]|uniref:Uncharacterized protein n=1 Tax=Larinioides sclopetarius TaxID=280406 RepID=A0AAV2BSS8_9ARAC